MSKIINYTEVEQFKKDGAILIKGKFDNAWIEKLKTGIKKAKEERAIMKDNGYKNGDDLSGKMFPTLYESN